MTNANVTVIIPAFNEESTIQRCVDSLLGQTIIPNIVIINDGSTDNTVEKVAKYESLDNVILINQANQGVSVARNVGIRAARTELITFVDADDYVEKDFIKVLLSGYLGKDNIDLSICNYSISKLNYNAIISGNFKSSIINPFEYFKSVIDETGVNGFVYNKLFEKSIIEKYNIIFDPQIAIGEDFLFCFLYGSYCDKIAVSKSVQIHYLPRRSGVSETMQIGGRFSSKIFDYFEANIKIIKLLRTLYDEKQTDLLIINKQICRTAIAATTIIRKTYLYNQQRYYAKLTRLKSFIKRNQRIIIKNHDLPHGDKVKILIAAYCPALINQFDRIKFN